MGVDGNHFLSHEESSELIYVLCSWWIVLFWCWGFAVGNQKYAIQDTEITEHCYFSSGTAWDS